MTSLLSLVFLINFKYVLLIKEVIFASEFVPSPERNFASDFANCKKENLLWTRLYLHTPLHAALPLWGLIYLIFICIAFYYFDLLLILSSERNFTFFFFFFFKGEKELFLFLVLHKGRRLYNLLLLLSREKKFFLLFLLRRGKRRLPFFFLCMRKRPSTTKIVRM